MHSRIYKGWVNHRRETPTQHKFRYYLFMLYLDLAELPQLFDTVPFWSARRPALAWFRRSDYFGAADLPLDTAIRNLVEQRLNRRPRGPIRLLTHLRYFGYCMNPVSFYYCFNENGEDIEAIVAEITNTPWGERHQYVLPVSAHGQAMQFEFEKSFHVSPFMPMDIQYQWQFSRPGPELFVNMRNFRADQCLFEATLALQQQALSPAALLTCLVAYPFITLRIIFAIHWQALRLWLKRTPIFDHP